MEKKAGDAQLAFDLRDEAIERVERGVNSEWKSLAARALDEVIDQGKPFISEDIWFRLEVEGVTTHDNRAMGPVILRAIRANKIKKSGYVQGTRASRHGAPIAQYEVL